MKNPEDSDSDWDSIVEPAIKLSDSKDDSDEPKKAKHLPPVQPQTKKTSKAKVYESDSISSNNRKSDGYTDYTESLQPPSKQGKLPSLPADSFVSKVTTPTDMFGQQKKQRSIFSNKTIAEESPRIEDFPPADSAPIPTLSLGIKSSDSNESMAGNDFSPKTPKEKEANSNKQSKEVKENILNMSFRNDKNKEKRVQKVEEERWMYTFDHGNYDEFRVTVDEPDSCINPIANRYDHGLRRCWLEIFSSLRLVTDFVVLLVIHLLRFITRDVAQPLVVGIFVIVCDYLLKPALAVSFSSLIQPIFVFVWNVLTSLAHALRPFLDIIERLVHILAHCCRSIRLVEITHHHPPPAIQRTEHL